MRKAGGLNWHPGFRVKRHLHSIKCSVSTETSKDPMNSSQKLYFCSCFSIPPFWHITTAFIYPPHPHSWAPCNDFSHQEMPAHGERLQNTFLASSSRNYDFRLSEEGKLSGILEPLLTSSCFNHGENGELEKCTHTLPTAHTQVHRHTHWCFVLV